MKEKLIEIIDGILGYLPWGEITPHTAEDIADRLIENGVTIGGDDLIQVVTDRFMWHLCWYHQILFKIGDRELYVSKALPEELVSSAMMAQKWIPVTERLPEHFGVFIVAIREPNKERVGKDCADFDPFAKTWLPSMCWDKGYEVTHWMPLPEPPKEENDES